MSELPIPSSDDGGDGGDGGNGSGEDVAMGEEEGEGKGEGASVGEYDDEWLMDTQSQGNKYFDCRRCALWRPSTIRVAPYNVCEYCHNNVADDDALKLR